ncbi:hypothetical protein ATL39_0535 [Sinobaca qinghaiensis]|uniref:Uncharacterized protein n=1 Tax=Sinobaca qinghaiensis TaxID=342944 RepID=A0A419V8S1_9BACL|nr:hypothetical protein [Sinobaca qinghaiensis]RKD76319.1 hypothetical protein ATL39_0535 [Sinobaca qinghaiensis]
MTGYAFYIEYRHKGKWKKLFQHALISGEEARWVGNNYIFIPYYKNWEWPGCAIEKINEFKSQLLRVTKVIVFHHAPHKPKSVGILELKKWDILQDGIMAKEYRLIHMEHLML